MVNVTACTVNQIAGGAAVLMFVAVTESNEYVCHCFSVTAPPVAREAAAFLRPLIAKTLASKKARGLVMKQDGEAAVLRCGFLLRSATGSQ